MAVLAALIDPAVVFVRLQPSAMLDRRGGHVGIEIFGRVKTNTVNIGIHFAMAVHATRLICQKISDRRPGIHGLLRLGIRQRTRLALRVRLGLQRDKDQRRRSCKPSTKPIPL